MIGRRAVIGLSLLCALLFSAFAAQGASALVATKSLSTTAFTCVEDSKKEGDFKDAHCDDAVTKGTGEYKHVEFAGSTPVQGTNKNVTDNKAGEKTKESEPGVLKGTIGLAKVTIECATVQNNTANSTIENIQPKVGDHEVKATIETEFKTCNVKELNKCIVNEPIVSKASVNGVEGMEGPKGEKNAMGLEFVGTGKEETFAEVTFTDKGVEPCSLHEKTFPVKGRVVATNGPTTSSAQENEYSGATLVFTPNFKMQTLKLGPNPATFETIATATNASNGNPLSLTTK